MANKVYLIVVTIMFLNALLGDGRLLRAPNGTLKTIKTPDGEVIDCVDIYKQPALSHPLLQNHTIQLKPSFETSNKLGSQNGLLIQSWQKYGQCPQGSIPILRTQKTDSPFHAKKSSPFSVKNDDPKYRHEWALVNYRRKAGGLQGAHAIINSWNPTVNPQGGSYSQIWLGKGGDKDLNSIEIGWRIVPSLGHNDARIFTYWTRDNYGTTGCYNMDCPGFVQTIPTTVLGGTLPNISAYDGVQFDIEYGIRLDVQTNNWWVTVMGSPQGYYPSTLFTTLQNGADILGWGGQGTDNMDAYYDTPTQVGSGHYPEEGRGKACYMTGITYLDNNGAEITPGSGDLSPLVTDSWCYDLIVDRSNPPFVFFGGPGCKKR
ncbi:hypothetical protein vseg_017535 [Gypsophila vaccaria]